MSEIPCARSTAMMRSPTGPAPVTSTRSSGSTPANRTAWRAIAVGSASAATLVGRESGSGSGCRLATVLYAQNAPRYPTVVRRGSIRGIPKAGPVGRAGTRRTPEQGSPPPGRPETIRSRLAQRPRSRTIRARGWPQAWRSAPEPCADRSRRYRTRRSRRAPRRVPAPDEARPRRRSCRRPHRQPPASIGRHAANNKGDFRPMPGPLSYSRRAAGSAPSRIRSDR